MSLIIQNIKYNTVGKPGDYIKVSCEITYSGAFGDKYVFRAESDGGVIYRLENDVGMFGKIDTVEFEFVMPNNDVYIDLKVYDRGFPKRDELDMTKKITIKKGDKTSAAKSDEPIDWMKYLPILLVVGIIVMYFIVRKK